MVDKAGSEGSGAAAREPVGGPVHGQAAERQIDQYSDVEGGDAVHKWRKQERWQNMHPGKVMRDQTGPLRVKNGVGIKGCSSLTQRLQHPPTIPQMQRAVAEMVGQMRTQMGDQRPGADQRQQQVDQKHAYHIKGSFGPPVRFV